MNPEEHAQHMEQMVAGLQAILESQDLDQCHQIAQELLQAEQGEQGGEQGAPEPSFEEQLMAAKKAEQGA